MNACALVLVALGIPSATPPASTQKGSPTEAPAVQAPGAYALILAEFGKDGEGEQTQTLVRYRFRAGLLVSREELVTGRSWGGIRYEFGGNRIYKGRWVISKWGDVVDLDTRKIVEHGDGSLLGIDEQSESVVVDARKEDFDTVYAYSLRSHQRRRLDRRGVWNRTGENAIVSPGGTRVATSFLSELRVEDSTGERRRLGELECLGAEICSTLCQVSFLWLDDSRLLAQRRNGDLVAIDLEGRTRAVLTVPDVHQQFCGPKLRRDGAGQIVWLDQDRGWAVDVARRSLTPYPWIAVGNDFEIEFDEKQEYGHVVRYRGSEIGRWWCDTWLAVTAPGHLAVAFGVVGSNLGYRKGVKVWSAESRQWSTIEPPWLSSVIGWIAE